MRVRLLKATVECHYDTSFSNKNRHQSSRGGLWAAQRANGEERVEVPQKHSTWHVLSPTLRPTVSSHQLRSNTLFYTLCSLYVLCSQNARVQCFCIYCTKCPLVPTPRPKHPILRNNLPRQTSTKQNMLSVTICLLTMDYLSLYFWAFICGRCDWLANEEERPLLGEGRVRRFIISCVPFRSCRRQTPTVVCVQLGAER